MYKTGNIEYESPECLYLLITMATGDGEALEYFKQGDIGDVDEDGNPEFLDGWGNPISYIRWPAGFESPRQDLNPATQMHDPFDPMETQANDYVIFPLVYSYGPDGIAGLTVRSAPGVSEAYPVVIGLLSPYGAFVGGSKMGAAGTGSEDNIHSHALDKKD